MILGIKGDHFKKSDWIVELSNLFCVTNSTFAKNISSIDKFYTGEVPSLQQQMHSNSLAHFDRLIIADFKNSGIIIARYVLHLNLKLWD